MVASAETRRGSVPNAGANAVADTSPPRPESPSGVLRVVVGLMRERLPTTWVTEFVDRSRRRPDDGVDAVLRLRTPGGEEAVVLMGVKTSLDTRDVLPALELLQRAAAAWGGDQEVVTVLAARYLPPATRAKIAAAGAGFVDATGNLLLTADRPAVFLSSQGADRDPWRGPGRPRGTLKGVPAARVVRALIDFAPPYTVPELAERSGASTGATYRVVEFLDGEGLIERERYGPITAVRWRELLMRWSEDYGFARSNTVQTFIEPRGVEALASRLAESPKLDYVVTGSLGAARAAPYAPARLATLYVRDADHAVAALGLRPADAGGNVAIATGNYDDVVFDRAELVDGVRVAALSQVAVDLLTGPGRNPSEATALLDWMEADERRWRR